MKKFFYTQKVWLLALCLPFLSQLVANGQPNCMIGIYTNPSPANPLTINFEAYPVFDSICFSPNSTYSWFFGDNSLGQGINPTHTYNQPGMYGICVTATTTFGFSVTACDTIEVGPQDCVASFDYSVSGFSGMFFPTISSDSACFGGQVVCQWSWGDGSSSNSLPNQSANHTYSTAGTYTVCLTATGSNGFSTTSCKPIVIENVVQNVNVWGQVLAAGNCLTIPTSVRMIAINGPEEYSMNIGTTPDSCYYFFNIPVQPSRAWVIRAEPSITSDYLPTYFGDVLYYTDATIFNTPLPPSQFNPPINLIANLYDSLPWDSLPPGLGLISGTIIGAGTIVTSTLNGYSVTSTFQPQNAHIIVLRNGMPVAIATVNSNGTFSIPNLPVGQYELRIDCPKIPSQSLSFELTESNLNRTFFFNTDGSGINSTTANNPSVSTETMTVVPNPASNNISFYGVEGKVSIIDAQGRKVISTIDHRNISIAHLPAGIYTIHGQSKLGKSISTRFVKN